MYMTVMCRKPQPVHQQDVIPPLGVIQEGCKEQVGWSWASRVVRLVEADEGEESRAESRCRTRRGLSWGRGHMGQNGTAGPDNICESEHSWPIGAQQRSEYLKLNHRPTPEKPRVFSDNGSTCPPAASWLPGSDALDCRSVVLARAPGCRGCRHQGRH